MKRLNFVNLVVDSPGSQSHNCNWALEKVKVVFGDYSGDVKVCFNKNQISISSDGIYLTSRIIDGNFPDYRQIIPKEFKTDVVVLKQDLLNALKLSNIFSDKFNQVNLLINPKGKVFRLSNSEQIHI